MPRHSRSTCSWRFLASGPKSIHRRLRKATCSPTASSCLHRTAFRQSLFLPSIPPPFLPPSGAPPMSCSDHGDLRVGALHHKQKELRHDGLTAAALRNDQHVRVADACVERRERNELPVGGFTKHERRMRGSPPRHFHGQ